MCGNGLLERIERLERAVAGLCAGTQGPTRDEREALAEIREEVEHGQTTGGDSRAGKLAEGE